MAVLHGLAPTLRSNWDVRNHGHGADELMRSVFRVPSETNDLQTTEYHLAFLHSPIALQRATTTPPINWLVDPAPAYERWRRRIFRPDLRTKPASNSIGTAMAASSSLRCPGH
jgi:hypothetical protein